MVHGLVEAYLITPLQPADELCFHCPLPECDETDPRCPYRLATNTERKAWMRQYMRDRRAAEREAAASP